MLSLVADFMSLVLAALLVGSMFGVWLFLNPASLDAASYTLIQQHAIRTLNTALPALGAATILFTVAAAALWRENGTHLWLLIVAVLCFVTSGLITRFLNQPINAIVITWHPAAPPSNWTEFRDAWWRWHLARLATGMAGLTLLIGTIVKRA